VNRVELDRERHERAGCVVLRYTRKGRRLVGLYRSLEAGIESDPATPWSNVCDAHSGVTCFETRKAAEACLSTPEEWCPMCQEEAYASSRFADGGADG